MLGGRQYLMSTAVRSGTESSAVEAHNLSRTFRVRQGLLHRAEVRAVDSVSFAIGHGETLGLVGESGCGKTTTAKMILGLERPTSGTVSFEGVAPASGRDWKPLRKKVQAVFQSPAACLSPRMRVEEILAEPLIAQKRVPRGEVPKRAAELLATVGLSASSAERFPHEFSGGQQQRIAIARALSVDPAVVVLDEPVSALDVSIRAQIVELLQELQKTRGVSYLLIAHDISLVHYMSHQIAVMYLGQIVEHGPADEVVTNSLHPYTRSLIDAVPVADPDLPEGTVVRGELPNPMSPPSGCYFHPRCPDVMPECREVAPKFSEIRPGHYAACHLYPESSQGTTTKGAY